MEPDRCSVIFSPERDGANAAGNWKPLSLFPKANREWGEEAERWNSPAKGEFINPPKEPLELLLGRVNRTRGPGG